MLSFHFLSNRFNSLEALDALLKVGSWPNTAAKYSGCTALHLAARFGHKEIIHRLLNEKGLDTEVTDQQEMTALHIAISRGYRKICQELLDNGASVTIITSKGRTSLHLAAASGSTDIVALVIKSGTYKGDKLNQRSGVLFPFFFLSFFLFFFFFFFHAAGTEKKRAKGKMGKRIA